MLDKAPIAEMPRRLFVTKFRFATALLALSLTAPAIAKEAPSSFTHQGVTYKYTVTNISDTRRVIEGVATPGNTFRLVVSGGRVYGTSNGVPVSFSVEEARGMANTGAPSVKVAVR